MQNIDKLQELKKQALDLMEKAGYPLTVALDVQLDPQLHFMGYTIEKEGKQIIVVSGMALDGGALNLLIHEMSHVYRIQSGHPSHDSQLLTAITAWVMHGRVVEPYQEKILHGILNIIQDIYADDISFKIFDKHEGLNEFFMSWIRKSVRPKTSKEKWENAENLLSAAFAQGNLERHKVPDTEDKVQKAIDKFLSENEKSVAEKYEFFKQFMVDLPEKVTEKEFEKLLISYLSEFLKLTK